MKQNKQLPAGKIPGPDIFAVNSTKHLNKKQD